MGIGVTTFFTFWAYFNNIKRLIEVFGKNNFICLTRSKGHNELSKKIN